MITREAFLLTACLLMGLGTSSQAMTDREIVEALEAIGDYESAYPLAFMLASEQGRYEDWREVAVTYARWDDGAAYDMAWQAARDLDREPAYLDFMTLRPKSPTNALAVRAIYHIRREIDTIAAYRDFIDRFPNTAEAVQALLRIYEIAFERAREADEPEIYDAFVIAFPAAEQTSEAIMLAVDRERQTIDEELGGLFGSFTSDEKRERIARRLYNEARIAEADGQDWIAARKYKILEGNEGFRDTAVLTEMMDREERLAYQVVMTGHQKEIAARIDNLQTAVTRELRTAANRLEVALGEYDRRIQQAMQAQARATQAAMQTQAQAMQSYVDTQVGAIGNAIRYQQQAMADAVREASYRSEALFRQAQEDARWENYQNRQCAEELAKHGKYGWLSGC